MARRVRSAALKVQRQIPDAQIRPGVCLLAYNKRVRLVRLVVVFRRGTLKVGEGDVVPALHETFPQELLFRGAEWHWAVQKVQHAEALLLILMEHAERKQRQGCGVLRLRKVADMTKIKIVSNPYNRSLSYYIFKPQLNTWEDIKQDSINSRLREDDEEKIFLPFKVKEIIDTIIAEYHVGADPIELVFEGTADEYEELLNICNDSEVRDKVHLFRSNRVLENARDLKRYLILYNRLLRILSRMMKILQKVFLRYQMLLRI